MSSQETVYKNQAEIEQNVKAEFKHIGKPSIRVIEECAELIKAICKAERFGYFNYHPDRPELNNTEEIKAEMDDVVEVIERFEGYLKSLRIVHSTDSQDLR